MIFLIDNDDKIGLQGVRDILFARPDVVTDIMILSDVNMKVAELALVSALCDCPGFSIQDIRKIKEQIGRTELDVSDPNYVSPDNYVNEFGSNYDDDFQKLCLLKLALQYKIASLMVHRQPHIISARVLGAQYRYSESQAQLRGQQFDDEFENIIAQICGGRGRATASVRVSDPHISF